MGFGGCAAVGLSNAGSACKDMLDLGFSLSRTPLPHESSRVVVKKKKVSGSRENESNGY